MKKFMLSMAVLLAASFAASAQVLDFYVGADVNGINCSIRCNYDKFVSVFGKPDTYISSGNPNDDDFCETYEIGENYFSFSDNGYLNYFELGDNRFSALTKFIKGGVRVGIRFQSWIISNMVSLCRKSRIKMEQLGMIYGKAHTTLYIYWLKTE